MNHARAAILTGKAGDEGPSFVQKRPRPKPRDRRHLDGLIFRQEQGDRNGVEERRRKLLDSVMALMPEDDRASSLPRLSMRRLVSGPAATQAADAAGRAQLESLTRVAVSRRQPRVTDTRREERRPALGARAVADFRGAEHEVTILNTSRLGLMIETGISPLIAEPLLVHFEDGVSRIYFVRWIRNGRVGLGCREEDLRRNRSR